MRKHRVLRESQSLTRFAGVSRVTMTGGPPPLTHSCFQPGFSRTLVRSSIHDAGPVPLCCSRELFSPAQKYQLLVYHADAIFHDKEYRNAACKYSMALQQKKVLSKTSKVRTSTGGAASNLQAQVCPSVEARGPGWKLDCWCW